jgi:hypothetical protein
LFLNYTDENMAGSRKHFLGGHLRRRIEYQAWSAATQKHQDAE